MKKLLIILLIIPTFVCSQTTEELDFIAPFNDGLAAVKKGDSWGFINDKGNIVIAFRNDLVLTETDGFKYPIFKNNRCLITEKKTDILYFGYIDKTGKTVIEPQFLNASNFNNNNYALTLKLRVENIGKNELLDKNIVYYKYFEVTIDTEGNIKDYLNPEGVNIALNKRNLKPPKITSWFISNDLIATMNENKKWIIKTINH